jgi:hypothetical protein
MLKAAILAAVVIVSVAAAARPASAQAAPAGVEKKNYNYSEWTKGRFSEAVTVTGPGKMIFLAGVGAEDENGAPGTSGHNANTPTTRSNGFWRSTAPHWAMSRKWSAT